MCMQEGFIYILVILQTIIYLFADVTKQMGVYVGPRLNFFHYLLTNKRMSSVARVNSICLDLECLNYHRLGIMMISKGITL